MHCASGIICSGIDRSTPKLDVRYRPLPGHLLFVGHRLGTEELKENSDLRRRPRWTSELTFARRAFGKGIMIRRLALRMAFVPILSIAAPEAALSGEQQDCGGSSFKVDAPTEALGVEICEALNKASEKMLECGLTQSKPISVEVVDGIAHPIGECLAYFDCDHDMIRVTNPESCSNLLSGDEPYSLLPPEILLRTLLTHKLAHALTHQSAGEISIDIVDQEYIAAALELEFLEGRWRDVLVQASPVSLPPKIGLIDIWIYGMAPRKFATNAWQHFRQENNGCGMILRIVERQFSFRR